MRSRCASRRAVPGIPLGPFSVCLWTLYKRFGSQLRKQPPGRAPASELPAEANVAPSAGFDASCGRPPQVSGSMPS